ncbi:MAG: hypothetical protein PWQ10_111 [Patescibacteria group bacterium]|nr:hypothetical protein [Patescibacteria group bacterium]
MIEVNLIPDVKQELIRTRRIQSAVITTTILVGLASIAIVALLAFWVFAVQAVRSNLADTQIKEGSKQLESIEDLSKVLTIQNQLTKITDLNTGKHIDSRTFGVLSVIIPTAPNDIQVSKFTVDSNESTITLEAQAYNGYSAVEIFKKTVEGAAIKYTDSNGDQQQVPLASDIVVSDASYGKDSSGVRVLRFNFSFNYTEELLSPSAKNVTTIITNNGNVTDSYLGVPNSIFVNRAADLKENN